MKVKTGNIMLTTMLVMMFSVGYAQAGVLNTLGDSGEFSRTGLADPTLPSGSYWGSHVTANAQVTLVDDGGTAPSNYVKMAIQWYPRAANMWYVNPTPSEETDIWAVSADISATLGRDYGDRYMRLLTCTSPGLFDPPAFEMNFLYHRSYWDPCSNDPHTIAWIAGSLSGTTAIPDMSTDWTKARIRYDATTGEAVGTFGDVEVFNVTIETGITINSVFFSRYNNGSTYDTGTFSVDNIVAEGKDYVPGILLSVPGLTNGQVLTGPAGLDDTQIVFSEPMTFSSSDVVVTDSQSAVVAATVTGSGTNMMDIQFAQTLLQDTYTVTIKDTVVSVAEGIALDGDGDWLAGGDAAIVLEHRRRTDLDNDNYVDLDDFAEFANDWDNE